MNEKTATVYIQLIQTFGRVATFAIVCGFGYMGIRELAGKQTEAIIAGSLQYSSGINVGLVVLAVGSFFYAMYERRFRISKIRYLTKRIKDLETDMDPNRSTSGLPSSGNTRPEDK